VVEHAVEQDPQPALARRRDQGVEIGVVAQAGIDAEVVDGVVAVGLGGEHRTERQPGRAQVAGVVEPVDEAAQPVHRRAVDGLRLGPEEAQRVDVPPDRVPLSIDHVGPPTESGSVGG
jgi:hypothetical protein